METHYLDVIALHDLILKIKANQQTKDDLAILNAAAISFHKYVDAVVCGEIELLIQGNRLQGKEYRDAVSQFDQDRHGCHETAIVNVKVINRLASAYELSPVFIGDTTQRYDVAAFCLELDQLFFLNRRIKLS